MEKDSFDNSPKIRITTKLLAKNTAINIFAQVVSGLVALVAIPFIIRGLGVERFGIFSIALTVLGYFTLFDFGLGRATTKFVAEALGKGEGGRIPSIVGTSLMTQLILGLAGGLLWIIVIPFMLTWLKIPRDLVGEARDVFLILGFSLPFILMAANLRGVLEAGQRFGSINIVKIPSNALTFLIPAVTGFFGWKLGSIMLLLATSLVVTFFSYFVVCLRVYPVLRFKNFSWESGLFGKIFSFGGWILACNLLVAVILSVDKFIIGSTLSLSAVSYYSVPYEAASRVQIFSAGFVMTLFAAFAVKATSDKAELEKLYARSMQAVFLVVGLFALLAVVLAREIFSLWLGIDFVQKSSFVFQILAFAMFVSAVGQVSGNFLDGMGRPDLRAKVFMAYALPYMGLVWFGAIKMGIVGVAAAWAIRSLVEFVLFFGVSWRLLQFRWKFFRESGLFRSLWWYGSWGVFLVLFRLFVPLPALVQGIGVVFALLAMVGGVWKYVLHKTDRASLRMLLRQALKSRSIIP